METFVLFTAIALTVFFINDKFSTAVRVIAFKESESEKNAKYSFLMMLGIIITWTIYFGFFKNH